MAESEMEGTLMNTPKVGRTKQARLAKLTPAERFFYEHAGYSYKPKAETREQGRIRCAIALAKAEIEASNVGLTFVWDWDECPDLSWMSEEELAQEHEVLCCRIPDPENTRYSLASLCGIVDADANYRRVIEAELASEAMHEYDREIETLDAH